MVPFVMLLRLGLIIILIVSFLGLIHCQKHFFNNFQARPVVVPYHRRSYHFGSGNRFLPAGPPSVLQKARNPVAPPSEEAEDRRLNLLQDIRKTKKKKFKYFKKHLTKCGMPFPIHLIRNKIDDDDVDEDYDTIKIKLPYGFSDEYYPIAESKNSTDNEDDDDDDDDIEDHNIKNPNSNKVSNNFLPQQPPRPVLIRPRAKFPMRVPPFKPIKGPVPMFGGFPRMVPRRPWGYPVPWRMARPGLPYQPFRMQEHIPGLRVGSPPPSPVIKTNEKESPRNKSTNQYNQPQNDYNQWSYYQSSQPHQQFYQPSYSYNPQYNQPDYSSYGNYYENGISSTTPASPHLQEVVDLISPQDDVKDEEKVVTVTPTPIWVFHSQISGNKNNETEARTLGSPRDLNLELQDQGNWVPLVPDVSGEKAESHFRIILDDVEIITSKYPTEAISSTTEMVRITDNGGGNNEELEIPSLSPNGGNSSRIRRSRIEDLSAVVSGSMTVEDY